MSTKVFISWSGELSKLLAEEIRNWLPAVLQYVKPYYTPDDIEKGSKWSTEIIGELESSEVGIICLTRDNLDKPWILFEAGALSKNFGKSKVCTLLFDVDSSDLTGPLTGFQDTKFNKKDFKKLIESINKEGGDSKLDSKILDDVFEMWWDKLELKITDILENFNNVDAKPSRTDRELLEEVLDISRLSLKRNNRSSRVPHELFMDLFAAVEHVSLAADEVQNDYLDIAMKKFRQPMRYLAKETGNRELAHKLETRLHPTLPGLFNKEGFENDEV